MSVGKKLKPFVQGKLDLFCSLYATTNALRLLFSKSAVKTTISWQTLMRLMLLELERKSFLSDIFIEGVTEVQLKRCHAAVRRYLRTKHGIAVAMTWGWTKCKKFELKAEMQRMQKSAASKSEVQLIFFGTKNYDHWSVVESVDRSRLFLFDSCGYGSRQIRHMHFDEEYVLATNKQTVLGPSSLVTIKLFKATRIKAGLA
jgi:Peptidase C39 family